MHYSQDWFSHNIPNIQSSLKRATGSISRILEVGSFEGRSACWFLSTVLPEDGEIQCLDIWLDGKIQKTFEANITEARKPNQTVKTIKAPSYESLARLIADGKTGYFDVVYVDGSHTAYDTITDMTMGWGLLRSGGVMLVDDYLWNHAPEECEKPKAAVDGFMSCFANQMEMIHKDWQVHLLKK